MSDQTRDFGTILVAIRDLPASSREKLMSYHRALQMALNTVDLEGEFPLWVQRALAHHQLAMQVMEMLEDDSRVILALIQSDKTRRAAPRAPAPPLARRSPPRMMADLELDQPVDEQVDEVDEFVDEAPHPVRPVSRSGLLRQAVEPPDDPDTPTTDDMMDQLIAQDSLVQNAHRRLGILKKQLATIKPRDPKRQRVVDEIEKIEAEIAGAFQKVSETIAQARLVRATTE